MVIPPVATCPNCGQLMEVVVLEPQSAPWVCRMCGRGFWCAELSDDARAMYRPEHNDWGFGAEAVQLRQQVTLEVVDAMVRGTSLRADLLPLVPRHVVEDLVARGRVRPAFLAFLRQFLDLPPNPSPPVAPPNPSPPVVPPVVP